MIQSRAWSVAVVILVVAAISTYIYYQPYSLRFLRNVSLLNIIFLIIIRILFQVINGLLLREFASKFGTFLKPKEWFGLSIVTTMGNYLSPFSGGMIARAAYLKHRHAFPYTQFASLLAANYLIYFGTIGAVGVLTVIMFGEDFTFYRQVISFLIAVVLIISIVIILPPVRFLRINRLTVVINNIIDGWVLIKADRILILKLVIYSLIGILLNGLSFWIAFTALADFPVSFGAVFLISLLSIFSILLNLTPSNFGIQEAIISLTSGMFGIGTSLGLMASLLIRVASLIPIFTMGPVFSFILTRELTNNTGRSDDDNERERI
ncbi:MAG TPA: lysylphosphatidylglycerol synthase transmembrane domain-containing protein [Syntrophales bacterium]|mgnify:CR=1 FL=1|nr:lysylphosphatidylglycerol synthase transmembrane domain-containing protein [Syntrophales bacterium]